MPALDALADEDTNRARQHLRRMQRHRSTDVQRAATTLLAFITSRDEAANRANRRELDVIDLRRRLEAIERALADAQTSLDEREVAERRLRDERGQLREQVAAAKEAVSRLEKERAELQTKLDAIKKIDLGKE